MREARITARLHHPHAVPVFDVVEHDGQPCLVMQYLPSRTLQEVLAESGTMPVDEAALIGAEVGSALAAAHAAGVVHRDVKPANILITEDGSAKISDFGISHVLGDARLTSTGMLTGTPAYLAPEVARGEPSSAASDVYSLGATLFAAVEASPPFGMDANAMALLHRVASEPLTPPARAGALTPVLVAMLDRDPAARPAMAEAAEWLQRLDLAAPLDEQPTAPMPPVTTMPLPAGPTGAPTPPTVAMGTPAAAGQAGPAGSARTVAPTSSSAAPPVPSTPPPATSERTDRRSRRGDPAARRTGRHRGRWFPGPSGTPWRRRPNPCCRTAHDLIGRRQPLAVPHRRHGQPHRHDQSPLQRRGPPPRRRKPRAPRRPLRSPPARTPRSRRLPGNPRGSSWCGRWRTTTPCCLATPTRATPSSLTGTGAPRPAAGVVRGVLGRDRSRQHPRLHGDIGREGRGNPHLHVRRRSRGPGTDGVSAGGAGRHPDDRQVHRPEQPRTLRVDSIAI